MTYILDLRNPVRFENFCAAFSAACDRMTEEQLQRMDLEISSTIQERVANAMENNAGTSKAGDTA